MSAKKSSIIRKSTFLWLAIPFIAVLEVVWQGVIPRLEATEKDWQDTADSISKRFKDGDLVEIVPLWERTGRMYLGEFLSPGGVGAFDTSHYRRLFEVSTRGAKSDFGLELEPDEIIHHGDVTITIYNLPPPKEAVFDLSSDLSRCRVNGAKHIRSEFIIDSKVRPRYMVRIPLKTSGVSIECPRIPLGSVLRYRSLVDYFKGKWRKSSPVELVLKLDGKEIARINVPNLGTSNEHEIQLDGDGEGTLHIEVRAEQEHERRFGLVLNVYQPQGGGL